MNKMDLFDKIEQLVNRDTLFICISGASCSGKSTFAKEIAKYFSYLNPLVLCEDRWYKDLVDIPLGFNGYYDMESEDSFWVDEFRDDVENIRVTKEWLIPQYEISTNKRLSKGERVRMSKMVILEGLHTIDIFRHLDNVCSVLYIYLDTDKDICVYRRIKRDTSMFDVDEKRVDFHYRNVIWENYKYWYNLQKDIVSLKGSRGVILNDKAGSL